MLFAALEPRKGEPSTNQQYEGHNGTAIYELAGAFFALREIYHYCSLHRFWRPILNCDIRSQRIARTLE